MTSYGNQVPVKTETAQFHQGSIVVDLRCMEQLPQKIRRRIMYSTTQICAEMCLHEYRKYRRRFSEDQAALMILNDIDVIEGEMAHALDKERQTWEPIKFTLPGRFKINRRPRR